MHIDCSDMISLFIYLILNIQFGKDIQEQTTFIKFQ